MRILKRIFILTALLVVGFSSQAKNSGMLKFGVSGGIQSTNFKLDGNEDAIENSVGFQVGAGLTINLPIISITPEVQYLNNKFTVVDPSVVGYVSKVRSHAVVLPVVVGIKLLPFITVIAGPNFNLYDNARIEYYDEEHTENLGGVRGGVGYLVGARLNFKSLSVGARYNGQFKKSSSALGDISSNYYSITVGFAL